MEPYWTKKRVAALLAADEEALDQWLAAFVDPVYTWMFYQVNGDAALAAEMTGKALATAVGRLSTFQPTAETMYHWLRDQAKQTRDEILLQRQTKPQRPWAWSQLPGEVLSALANLRGEALPETIGNHPCVQEITQAALVEMGQLDRELMKHRYSRLDAPEHIAEALGESIEQVSDRLYRCRHFFRRVFIQLVQSENAGFAESTAGGDLELLDTNLEKLLTATALYCPIPRGDRAVIGERVKTAAAETAARQPQRRAASPVLWGAVAGLVVVGIVAMAWLMQPAPVPPAPPTDQPPARQIAEKPLPAPRPSGQIDQEQLRQVLEFGQQGNLDGLLQILRRGTFESQFAASHFVGKFGDESAIGLLLEAEQRWYPNGPDDNAFATAIEQIEDRLLAESNDFMDEPLPEEPEPADTAATEPEPETPAPAAPAISGTVIGVDGTPVGQARLILSKNPLMAESAGGSVLNRVQTNETGQYAFAPALDGPVFVDCAIPPGLTVSTRKALLCSQGTPRRLSFGGLPVVTGTLDRPEADVDGQILYLSDTLDPADASFRCETVTGADGRFAFPGVDPGSYYLLYNTPDNRIVWLETVDVGDRAPADLAITAVEHTLTVRYQPPAEAEAPAITGALLTYGPDVSADFQQYELVRDPDDEAGTFTTAAPAGSYTLVTTFVNDLRRLDTVELTADRTLEIDIPAGTASLAGRFTGPSPLALMLISTDQQLRFDLRPEDGGLYAMGMMPEDTYSLAAIVHGRLLTFLDVEVRADGTPQVLDIDPAGWMDALSGLYVIVADADGRLVTDAQVWLTGDGPVLTARSTGRGAFLAAPAGAYSLHAAAPGRTAVEQAVTLNPRPLLAPPNPGNTVTLQLP